MTMWWARKDENGSSSNENRTPEKLSLAGLKHNLMKAATPPSGSRRRQRHSNNHSGSSSNVNSVSSQRGSVAGNASSHGKSNGSSSHHRSISQKEVETEDEDDEGNKAAMTLAETHSGIEVSLSSEASPLFYMTQQIALARKVYKTQFPVGSAGKISSISTAKDVNNISFTKQRLHRVVLCDNNANGNSSAVTFDDALFLLRSHEPVDERTCVIEELNKIKNEIQCVVADKADLQRTSVASFTADATLNKDKPPEDSSSSSSSGGWDIHRTLLRSTLDPSERLQLQNQRGVCLTVSMPKKAREIFLSKCGMKQSWLQQLSAAIAPTVRSENCREGGAGATIQHIAIMPSAVNEVSFFISRDSGKAFHWGHLPDRLFRRMQQSGLDPHHSTTDIIYLATGPLGAYYVEFRSGECWWGCIAEDNEFHDLCNSWDVARVVFGCGRTLGDFYAPSWIILSRDGRVAWKNVPARLHRKLESRMANESAPCDVSLGSGDSYFVRFLDGTTDYCLPAAISTVCRSTEKQGGNITAVYMHPELSHDFIIRSTNLRRDP